MTRRRPPRTGRSIRRSAGRSADRRTHCVSLASLVLVLAASATSWGTLCIGEDGHVALEPVVGSGCCDAADAPDARSGAALADLAPSRAPCCGPCTDLYRTEGRWLVTGAPQMDPESELAFSPGAARSTSAMAPDRLPRAAHDAARSGALEALAASVIRC